MTDSSSQVRGESGPGVMGNEGSSFQPHAAVTRPEIAALQQSFPQKPSPSLGGKWSEVLEPEQVAHIEKSLRNKSGVITFQNYQQLYGDVVKGGVDKKVSFLLLLIGESSQSSQLDTDKLHKSVLIIVRALLKTLKPHQFEKDHDGDDAKFTSSLVHDLVYGNEKRKTSFAKEPVSRNIDVDDIETLILKTPLLESVVTSVAATCFHVSVSTAGPGLLPALPRDTRTSVSALEAAFLAAQLPHELRHVWRPLFNTDTHGESFSKLAGAITRQGPTIIIIWDEAGNVFGGFATDPWKMGPKFYGKQESFLFHLHPKMNVYDTTPFNTNYQYFNLKQKTMPNGLGMGGQLEYFGFWIDNEFGILKTSPSCSTYHSPQLAETEGKIRRLEVFGVGELKDDDLEGGPSVLDMDPEAQAVLEMMGKTFHSKVIREVDEDQERKRELEQQQLE